MLLHVPEVLDADAVRAMRAALGAAPWEDGRNTAGPQGASVKHNLQLAAGSPLARQLGQQILAALSRSALFHAAALPRRFEAPLFNRYEGGGQYGMHVDGAMRQLADGSSLRTDLSCTLFLTEPHEYDGGELMVADTYGTHEVKLPAGDLILYPSTSLHRVEPVTRGARVSSFFWLQSLVRDDAQRSMLFDLDQTIQQLRQRHGDSPQTVALTAHYHNLLRRWAET
ncbi:Fe2+-dependent dioxygenase [Pseudorhodoferax sp.]|uniref:Fe2+-dependent dioxygenase n=1 Tax=Pseudorhodoferax sp. TaxID=1993553 RepID=UPI002DD65EF0|nr:Fe2+-dependent dioxygenase [Pseudorhodoferax sp.]